mmetsp:Transcript_86034/g.221517  ORF Transcript_86034/g.221517 Transcript_86034/m.221517 type:complete len:945 (+) Transcript_86034:144-2978(+)
MAPQLRDRSASGLLFASALTLLAVWQALGQDEPFVENLEADDHPESRRLLTFLETATSEQELTAAAVWGARDSFDMVSDSGTLILAGGYGTANAAMNDVWASTDGVTWTARTTSAGWYERYGHSLVVLGSQLLLLGGYGAPSGQSKHRNDVWSSSDGGATWTELLATAPWTGRRDHACAVFNGEVFLTGGTYPLWGDVWASSDGVTWTERTSPGWSARMGHALVAAGDRLLLAGGFDNIYLNDVWSSTDGNTWTELTAAAEWTPRRYFALNEMPEGYLVLASGYAEDTSGTRSATNEMWISADQGATWTQQLADGAAQWGARYSTKGALLSNELILAGGRRDSDRLNDVWAIAAIMGCSDFSTSGSCPSGICIWSGGSCAVVTTSTTKTTSSTTITTTTTTSSTTSTTLTTTTLTLTTATDTTTTSSVTTTTSTVTTTTVTTTSSTVTTTTSTTSTETSSTSTTETTTTTSLTSSTSTVTTSTVTSSTSTTFTRTTTRHPRGSQRVTSYLATLLVDNPTTFSEQGYIAAVAVALGVPAAAVQVTGVRFEATLGYTFTTAVTDQQASAAIAYGHAVAASSVSVTVTAATGNRRMRRLSSVETTAVITLYEAASAAGLRMSLAEMSAIQGYLAANEGVQTDIAVGQAMTHAVQVDTQVIQDADDGSLNISRLGGADVEQALGASVATSGTAEVILLPGQTLAPTTTRQADSVTRAVLLDTNTSESSQGASSTLLVLVAAVGAGCMLLLICAILFACRCVWRKAYDAGKEAAVTTPRSDGGLPDSFNLRVEEECFADGGELVLPARVTIKTAEFLRTRSEKVVFKPATHCPSCGTALPEEGGQNARCIGCGSTPRNSQVLNSNLFSPHSDSKRVSKLLREEERAMMSTNGSPSEGGSTYPSTFPSPFPSPTKDRMDRSSSPGTRSVESWVLEEGPGESGHAVLWTHA